VRVDRPGERRIARGDGADRAGGHDRRAAWPGREALDRPDGRAGGVRRHDAVVVRRVGRQTAQACALTGSRASASSSWTTSLIAPKLAASTAATNARGVPPTPAVVLTAANLPPKYSLPPDSQCLDAVGRGPGVDAGVEARDGAGRRVERRDRVARRRAVDRRAGAARVQRRARQRKRVDKPLTFGSKAGSTVPSARTCAKRLRANVPNFMKFPPTYQPPAPSETITLPASLGRATSYLGDPSARLRSTKPFVATPIRVNAPRAITRSPDCTIELTAPLMVSGIGSGIEPTTAPAGAANTRQQRQRQQRRRAQARAGKALERDPHEGPSPPTHLCRHAKPPCFERSNAPDTDWRAPIYAMSSQGPLGTRVAPILRPVPTRRSEVPRPPRTRRP
jgi:hypothetical protein